MRRVEPDSRRASPLPSRVAAAAMEVIARALARRARTVWPWPLLLAVALTGAPCAAAVYPYPSGDANIIGQVRVVTARAGDTLLDIARYYDVGYHAIVAANPKVDPWLPGAGTRVVVPSEFILPPRPWKGIVINLPQRRLFYFPPPRRGTRPVVLTFPIGIFQPGWPDRLGRTRIIRKVRMPRWVVPTDIRTQEARLGHPLPKVVAPGAHNPMGELALQTALPEIYIHGTNRPWSVGMRTSHGCFHLYPEDEARLFRRVPVGTPVRIIDQPYLAGQRSGMNLYFAAFPVLDAYRHHAPDLQRAIDAITRYLARTGQSWRVDWSRVTRAVHAGEPVPEPVSRHAPTLRQLIAALPVHPYGVRPYGAAANGATPPPPPAPVGSRKAG